MCFVSPINHDCDQESDNDSTAISYRFAQAHHEDLPNIASMLDSEDQSAVKLGLQFLEVFDIQDDMLLMEGWAFLISELDEHISYHKNEVFLTCKVELEARFLHKRNVPIGKIFKQKQASLIWRQRKTYVAVIDCNGAKRGGNTMLKIKLRIL